ncbi:hypothetical protein HV306_20015 [Klebsiella grimontii]|uniref:hypothetical protein n=1 Tax=Klebsiella grimontii TaxID=2058152 RepID=UPI0015E59281|nr:hypothetical protein [Klebsiella grimontii]QLO79244.1 hypothetical protein HV306_20015 [Klebsiella grimontii]
MTRYNTGYPVPSPAMPDVWDNNETIDSFVNSPESSVTTRTGIVRDTMFGMQKKADEQRIAASVALAEQMDSQESAFNAAQTDKEDRFQGFLNSSGYVFLGNYENGPFQFSARNQYIRYNNQYYRLNAATDTGFTTTGTDANSFANDVTHFVLMDGDTLRQDLGSDEDGMGDALTAVKQPFLGATSQTQHDKNARYPDVFDWYMGESDHTLMFQRAANSGVASIFVPDGEYIVGDINLTAPVKFYGKGSISIDALGARIIKPSGANHIFQFLGDPEAGVRPHGGGLLNLSLSGQKGSDTGMLVRAQTWSYLFFEQIAFQNLSGWGLSLQDVAEGGLHNYLCRRLGSEDTGCIRFEDYIDIPNNNVNNFSLWRGIFGFNSGTWIYGTDRSNLDVVSIENHKFEYDDKPVSGNLTQKSVIYLGQANRVNIKRNFFTNFKLTNANLYTNCMRIGANSRVKPNISDNQFSGCDNSLLKIEGGTVEGYGNVANRGDATADGTFVCTSNLPQDIEPIIYHTNNGAKNKRSNYDAPGFVSAHKMTGLVNNPFVPDANSMTHYGTVMSVAALTEIRRGTISRALISDREFVHITARMKNVSGTASSIILNLDGVDFGSVSVTADSQWHNYTWQIRPDKISNGSFILTNGASPILFDGIFIERKNYLNWSFAWVPGTIAAGQTATSPVQSVVDTTGFVATGVEATANGSLNGTILQPSMDADGNVIIYCKNNTASSITPSFSRIRLKYESAGRIS